METISPDTRGTIQKLLDQEVTYLSLKATGYCNFAYYVETRQGGQYIVKQEKDEKEAEEQNSLPIEARLIKRLAKLSLSVPVPDVVFISEDPALYGYKYIDGEPLINVWDSLSKGDRISICEMLGKFHAEIGAQFTREDARSSNLKIDMSVGLHPEVTKEYETILASNDVPDSWKDLARQAEVIFDGTLDRVVFQFIHNDAHHENVLIRNKKIVGIIDFGDAEYGEVAKEFSRYIRDYPEYFEYIINAYQVTSGNTLSRARLVSNAFLSGLAENVEDYHKGGENRLKAELAITTYRKLLQASAD